MEHVTFKARDGYPLVGQLTVPEETPKAGVLVSAGTGYKARYYQPFAKALAAAGLMAFTYDCRGIGKSAPEDLSQLSMRYSDWGRWDMPAALDTLAGHAQGLPLLHVGHSVGGHFVGFWDNHEKVTAHAFVCVGSGYLGDRPWWKNPAELAFWHVIGPRSINKHGYVQSGRYWKGASLPRGVFEDWKTWCHRPGYYRRDLEGPLKPHHFESVTTPITSFIYTDDLIATPQSGDKMLAFYPNAPQEMRVRRPSAFGIPAIGHGGPFSDRLAPAREEIITWCKDHATTPAIGFVGK
ncbi:MAG: alpha/beta hydrolase [Pseudomonadota bacterium]